MVLNQPGQTLEVSAEHGLELEAKLIALRVLFVAGEQVLAHQVLDEDNLRVQWAPELPDAAVAVHGVA